MSASAKKILIIGATGAQGIPVITALLESQDGKPSPYSVRALTRDPTSKKAQILASKGVEIFKGSVDDMNTLVPAMEGCYGVFVNTDTYAVGAPAEIYAAIKMFEHAHRVPEMRHFIWSSLDYSLKFGKYDPKYSCLPMDTKGIVNDFLRVQDSSPSGDSLTWSILTTGPYIENLTSVMLGPLPNRDENGALVFATPMEDSLIPAISLDDIGWWTRYTFDHRSETSGQELKIASETMTVDQVVETFSRVTGIPAVRKRLSVDEFWANWPNYPKTLQAVYNGLYSAWRDGLVPRDMEWIRRVHPTGFTLESWIKERGYDGTIYLDYSQLKSQAELKLLSH